MIQSNMDAKRTVIGMGYLVFSKEQIDTLRRRNAKTDTHESRDDLKPLELGKVYQTEEEAVKKRAKSAAKSAI